MRKYNILLADDDPNILRTLSYALRGSGFNITEVSSGEDAIDRLKLVYFDLVITDLVMGGADGIDVLKKAKFVSSDTMVIILTGHGDMKSVIKALRLDADDYIVKPCEPEELFFRINRCLSKLDLARKIKLYEKMLPVCCVCKKIRDDSGKEPGSGNWMRVEDYVLRKTGVEVTSSYCPECAGRVEKELENQGMTVR